MSVSGVGSCQHVVVGTHRTDPLVHRYLDDPVYKVSHMSETTTGCHKSLLTLLASFLLHSSWFMGSCVLLLLFPAWNIDPHLSLLRCSVGSICIWRKEERRAETPTRSVTMHPLAMNYTTGLQWDTRALFIQSNKNKHTTIRYNKRYPSCPCLQ